MKLINIKEIINWLKTDFQNDFDYIWYAEPKENIDWNVLIMNDLSEIRDWCLSVHKIEIRIIGAKLSTQYEVKALIDKVNDGLDTAFIKYWFTKLELENESSILFNSQDKFEKVLIYKIF